MSTQEACKRFGIEYQTAAQAVRVCKAIGSCRQRQLSFEHHKEVAGRDDKAELLAVTMSIKRKAGEMLEALEKIAEEGNRKKSEAAKGNANAAKAKKKTVVDHRDPPVAKKPKVAVAREARAAEAKVTR
jgi:triphosphoribosyl-dephospho-CoA synthetase